MGSGRQFRQNILEGRAGDALKVDHSLVSYEYRMSECVSFREAEREREGGREGERAQICVAVHT